MTEEAIGHRVIDLIIASSLVRTAGDEPAVFVWSANAPEQIGAMVKDLYAARRQRSNVNCANLKQAPMPTEPVAVNVMMSLRRCRSLTEKLESILHLAGGDSYNGNTPQDEPGNLRDMAAAMYAETEKLTSAVERLEMIVGFDAMHAKPPSPDPRNR